VISPPNDDTGLKHPKLNRSPFASALPTILPLPTGEGRGEGQETILGASATHTQ